jgi:hypothetical protein
MVRVYRDAKAGKIDAQLVGRLVHTLDSLVAIDGDHDFERRSRAPSPGSSAARNGGAGHWGARP